MGGMYAPMVTYSAYLVPSYPRMLHSMILCEHVLYVYVRMSYVQTYVPLMCGV